MWRFKAFSNYAIGQNLKTRLSSCTVKDQVYMGRYIDANTNPIKILVIFNRLWTTWRMHRMWTSDGALFQSGDEYCCFDKW